MRMKSRFLIWLSALALLVLIAVQFMFVTDTYVTKQKQFDAKYGNLAREALREFNNQDFNFTFDSVLYLMDNMALEYQFPHPDSMLPPVAEAFNKIMSGYVEPREFMKDFILKADENPEFTYMVHMKDLFLLDAGFEQQVYPDSLLLDAPPDGALRVGSYTHERNFFRISYDVYINFRNRTQLVLNEMWLILLLTAFTLLLVFSVYYMTLRNMLLQKRLSEMKTDFINNMTHELKTPLSTISVASSTLEKRDIIRQEDKVEELSGLIKKQNRHLTELIDRILDINIWEKDQVRVKRQQVKVDTWIRGLADAFRLERYQGSIELTLEVDFPTGSISMDDVHMSTAVNNLLSNAVKYGNSPCLINVSVSESEGFLRLCVADNGPGIRKDELKHIFEKFFRGRESKQRVTKGLGLGLYYVKQIVEAHGGTILARSDPGKKTEFIIKIPLSDGNTTG